MAQKVLVQLVDDLDGSSSSDISTVTFGLDGVSYEIDLNEDNASNLREHLSEFISSARRTGGRVRRGGAPGVAGRHSKPPRRRLPKAARPSSFRLVSTRAEPMVRSAYYFKG